MSINNLDIGKVLEFDYKINKNKKIKFILRNTPNIEERKITINDYLKYDDLNKIVSEFYVILSSNFNSNIFNKNIENLKIKKRDIKLLDLFAIAAGVPINDGGYDDIKNSIELLVTSNETTDDLRSTLMHELLHMASSKNNEFTGFSQIINTNYGIKKIGSGLNEGYTEKLNREYFSKVTDFSIYDELIELTTKIENLVGKEKMQELYFNADLYGLFNEIIKYDNIENVGNIIVDMDKLISTNKNKTKIKYNKIQEKLDIISLENRKE